MIKRLKVNLNVVGRGYSLAQLGLYEKAITSYEKALQYQSNNDGVWFLRGFALNKLKLYEEAVNSYNEAIKLKPNFHEVWFFRAASKHLLICIL